MASPASELLPNPKITEEAPDDKSIERKTSPDLRSLIVVSLPPLGLFLFGVATLRYFEGWDWLISCYVITQMCTTVGYGDFTVNTPHAKFFMAIYALLVLVFLAYYYNMLVGRLVQWESDALRKYIRKLEVFYDEGVKDDQYAMMKYGHLNEMAAGLSLFVGALVVGVVFFRLIEHCACSHAIPGCDDTSYASCSETGGYVKGWIDCFYMSCITLTTVGFGDFQPRTTVGRIFGMAWMLVGVATTAATISAVSNWFFDAKKGGQFSSIEGNPDIDDETFKKIDLDGNGSLSRGEYMTYTLVKYGVVQEELLKDINRQYDNLDSDKSNAVTLSQIHDARKHRAAQRSG